MLPKIKNKQINTVFAFVLLFFAIFIIYPAIILFKNAFTTGSGTNTAFSLSNFVFPSVF